MISTLKTRMVSKEGFTLIEVALALLVLGIGMLSLMAVFPAGLAAGRHAADDGAVVEFSDAVFMDYEWQMSTGQLGASITYTSSPRLISSSGAQYNASGRLSPNTWLTVYQNTPSGQFPEFEVFMAEAGAGLSGNSDLRRVDLYFVKPGVGRNQAKAFQVFTRFFTYYKANP